MNTMTLESLLVTEDEWVATEGVGSAIKAGAGAIKRGASAVWTAIVELIKRLIAKIRSLFKKNQDVKRAIHNPSGNRGGTPAEQQKRLVGPAQVTKQLSGPTPVGIDRKVEIAFIGDRIAGLSYTLNTLFNRETNAIFTLRKDNVVVDSALKSQVAELMSKYPAVQQFNHGSKTVSIGALSTQLDQDAKICKEVEMRLAKLLMAAEKLEGSEESYRQHAEICRNLLSLSARLATYIDFQTSAISRAA